MEGECTLDEKLTYSLIHFGNLETLKPDTILIIDS